ncbi:MAG: NUDIX hydrolase [Euzebyaceae bacterium]|jgi:8-oxo-dGTP pyrophosphatase MutT (NUDIX family)|nr:NUDIX hydrolase [Euzebyaceae bacterium]
MARYPTRQAVSSGGLVFQDRHDGRWVVLISRRNTAGQLQWTLPKGGLEAGEDLEAAAVREVREETGLDSAIVAKLGVVDYWFVWKPDAVRYHKYVHYFLLAFKGGDTHLHDDEAEEVAWLPLDEACLRLTHANERRLVKAAEPAADAVGVDPAGRSSQTRPPAAT